MTRRFVPVLLLCMFVTAIGREATAQAPAQGQDRRWVTLLDWRTQNAFTSVGTANWRVVDDVVKADGGNGYLVTRDAYGDFELRAEFWVSPDANSGIFIRCSDPQQITANNSYEVNIFDRRPDPTYRTGGIVNIAKVMTNVDAGNQWNTMEIVARGPKMTVRLNGMVVAEGEDTKFARGPIALQYGTGDVRFRRVQIR